MNLSNNSIAIIPARGGSKRIPDKNIKDFCGKPIIAYSIKAALESKVFDHVIVSTDSQKIANIALECGAEVPFLRSETIADDITPVYDVICESYKSLTMNKVTNTYVFCLFATAPFLTSQMLKAGLAVITKNKTDALLPIVAYNKPIQRALKKNGPLLEPIWANEINSRSQDLVPSYYDAGLFWIIKSENLINKKMNFYNQSISFLELSERESHDIDNPKDWETAELKYKSNFSYAV